MEDREEQKDRYQTKEERDGEQDGEDEHILEHWIKYCMMGSYPPGLTKDKKRAVRKRARAVTVENGEIYLQWRKYKVCTLLIYLVCQLNTKLTCNFSGKINNLCWRSEKNPAFLPLQSYLWALWCYQDMVQASREVLLERNVPGCEKVGKFVFLICDVELLNVTHS